MGFSGTKRKEQEAPFASPAGADARPPKRSSPAAAAMEARSGWASLLPELTRLIADRVLAADVVDYISMRAACARWRASTATPVDPTLRDARLRPRRWVALCDGDGVRPADAGEVAFLSTATGRRVRVRLPGELCGGHHRIVGFTDGLLILLDKRSTAVRVLHPFTGAAVELPPIAHVFGCMGKVRDRPWLRAAVCASSSSTTSIAVVAWFPTSPGVVVAEAGGGSPYWSIVHHSLQLGSAVSFQGRLYATIKNSLQIQQIYPKRLEPRIAWIRGGSHVHTTEPNSLFLVESAARLLLVLRNYPNVNPRVAPEKRYLLFELLGMADEQSESELAPVSSIGDQALFLGHDRCISVSANDLPSITGDAIYFSPEGGKYPTRMYSVSGVACDELSTQSIIHDGRYSIRPSVRPFTLADQLFTFCSHRCWSRGLMFHEYHCIPSSWKDLAKKHRDQDREVQFPNHYA